MCLCTCWVHTNPLPHIRHLYFNSCVWHLWWDLRFFSNLEVKLLHIVHTNTWPSWLFACAARSPLCLKSHPHPRLAHIHVLIVWWVILCESNSLLNAKLSSQVSHTNCLFRLCEYRCRSRVLGQLKVFLQTGHKTGGWLLW